MLTALLAVACASCEPLADDLDIEREEVPVFDRATPAPVPKPRPTELRVMAWNIKYGACRIDFWFDAWGDRVQMSRSEVVGNLARIEQLVREVDPDILMTEEIEVDSRRSAYVDMVQHMLDHTGLNHGAYFETWDSRYVPSEGLGRINLGNAIFSRYPIKFAERIRQVDRTDQDGLTRTFYIHRMIGRAIIDVGAPRELAAYVVHTEAYDRDGTKGKQLQQIYDEVSREGLPFVLGGDFNELPPRAVKLAHFADEHPSTLGTEFEQPPYTPALMQKFYDRLVPAISLERYGTTEAEQRAYYTHSLIGPNRTGNDGSPGFWNRTLDYLFVDPKGSWVEGTTDVLQTRGRQGIESEPLELSDHAPVVGTFRLAP